MGSYFAKETDLCAAFVAAVPEEWSVYPETGGFDLLLVRKADGFQIGIEAKLRLNAKVITQAAEGNSAWNVASPGPDCRAVLIPAGVSLDFAPVCALLGITVIKVRDTAEAYGSAFDPRLPSTDYDYYTRRWFERAPDSRIELPDYVPDVIAGDSAPVALTPWKIKAIKLVVTMQKRGFVTRKDFRHFDLSMSRWIDPYARWLVPGGAGWIAGPYLPDFEKQHPVNFGQIAADYEKWKAPDPEVQTQFALPTENAERRTA